MHAKALQSIPASSHSGMSRLKAAGLHLCISVAVAAIASGLLLGVWYPPPYFHAGDAGKLLALVVGVDVAIGPLLTLLVFKAGKRGLKLDLTVIAILQAAALVYGFQIIVRSRPVFMVAAVDRFVLVDADQIADKDLAAASEPQWRRRSWTGPVMVAAKLPHDAKEYNALLFMAAGGGKDVQDFPKYYVPYASAAQALLQHAHPIARLRRIDPANAAKIDAWLAARHLVDVDVAWVPIQTRAHDMAMILNARDGQPIGPLPVNPWPSKRQTLPSHATGKAGRP